MSDLQSIMFPVKEVPAIWADRENGNILNKDTGHKFIVREDTGEVLSCMTDEYQLVENKRVMKFADPIIKKNKGVLKEALTFNNGARTRVKWSFPDHKVSLGKNENIEPQIIFDNSYNGTVGVNIMSGAFRIVCSNGLVIGVVIGKYRNKHSVYNISLDDLESVIYDTMEKTKMIFKDDFQILFDTDLKEKHIIKFIKMFPIQANEVITGRLIADKPKTYWDLLNVGTNVLSHNMNRKTEATHIIENQLYPAVSRWAASA
tara:strand:- start:556 stop:1335 length:780 start_codon:yes stop_codon:yes gene_type:complete